MKNLDREYCNEPSLKFEITALNLKRKYDETKDESLRDKFNKRVQARITEVRDEIEGLEDKEHSYMGYLEKELDYLKNLTFEKQNKDRFGVMLLLIIKNLAKKPCFAGYTNNWKDEFYSKAIENCLKYIHNFDETKVSQRTGKTVSAFSYVTQIIYTAFLIIINERKKDEKKRDMYVSLEEAKLTDKDNKNFKNTSSFDFQYYIGIQKNIVSEIEKTLNKIDSLIRLENEKIYIDNDIFSLNNVDIKKRDEVFNEELQKLVNKQNELILEISEIKKDLNVDYIPKEIHLVTLKNNTESYKKDVLNLCNKHNLRFTYQEVTKDEYNGMKLLDKKIPKKIVEDW